ncbi:MAG TPA: endolytic transglycosylase MltG [Gemmatimonadaceae bacterium]|nr:endolytic transglycosylase MltG [Gemmatimonadaceae bacterium]
MRRIVRGVVATTMCAIVAACGSGTGAAVRVAIPPGATLRIASDSLAKAGVIRFPRLFRVYASVRRSDRGIKSGTYALHKDAGWGFVLDALRGGKGIVHVVTIPEGFSLSQIAAAVAAKLKVPADSVMRAASDTALLHQLDVPTPTLEGYLFPDTYTFQDGTTARAAVDAMVRRFEQVWKPEWTARLDTLHLSRNDVMALASIVEKEAKVNEERPVIAAVYLNRLRDGMLLQADPTVQYALGKHVARVFYKDLDVDSPYNTYKHKGLPPGPIASPGRASIEAALYPANVPYEYFVAFPDGHHEFRADLKSHEAAKLEARKAWDSLEAKPLARRADSTRSK